MEEILKQQSNAILKTALLEIVDFHNTGILKDRVVRILHKDINQYSIIKFDLRDVEYGITLELAKRWAGLSMPPETTVSDIKAFSLEAAEAMAVKESNQHGTSALLIEKPGDFYSVAVGKHCVAYQKKRHPERIIAIYEHGAVAI